MASLPLLGGITVIKVGGSLCERGDPLPAMRAASALARQYPLLIVPGGAEFAESVRRASARFALDDLTAHQMALLAMDQYGLLLAALVGAPVTPDLQTAVRLARSRDLPVLLPSRMLLRAPLPASWQVTSDAIAAWIAGVAGADRLILLKDVDGAYREDSPADIAIPRRARATVRAMDLGGVVDEAFARYLPAQVRCWILNGSLPDRLQELLQTGITVGTEVSG